MKMIRDIGVEELYIFPRYLISRTNIIFAISMIETAKIDAFYLMEMLSEVIVT